ncbi:hypothetical protein P3L10_006423 [Capsicum annuum]
MNVSSTREMNDSLAAITERKPQRPCGCVGIFFQLFDRNRRFAKKLFPKKLFSPGCLKQASKKFEGDEKQPKFCLIAYENSGGFPNAKNNGMTNTPCESKREMKGPSLVARLIGLESMPAGSGSKPQKASASETWSNVADELGARPGGSDKVDLDLEMAEIKSLEPGLRSKNGTPNVEEYSSSVSSPVSSDSGSPCEGPGRNMPRLPIFSSRDQLETLERVSEGSSSNATAEIDDVSYCAELILRKRSTSRTLMEMHGTLQGNNVKKDASSVTRVVNQKQNQASQNSERGLMKSKPSSLQSNRVLAAAESMNNTQNFVAQNKRPSRKEDLCDDGDVSSRNTCMNFQAIPDSAATDLVGNSLDHHSSGCVLEAAFSTDSYLSCSPNSSSKGKALAESVDSIDDEPLFPEPDRDLSGCETSSSTRRRSCRELITDHFNNVSEVLSKIDQLKKKQTQLHKTEDGTRTKLPSSMTKEILIADIIDEVEEWTEFIGLIPDELAE